MVEVIGLALENHRTSEAVEAGLDPEFFLERPLLTSVRGTDANKNKPPGPRGSLQCSGESVRSGGAGCGIHFIITT